MDDALRLALESGLPYTGLRGFDVDPRLLRYIPLQHAAKAQVVPVILIGDTLKVASATADPDLAAIRKAFPNLRLDVVIAPAAEIAASLHRAEGAA